MTNKSETDADLVEHIRKRDRWLFDHPPSVVMDENNPPILIYQMGKVGSTSIRVTLEQSGLPNPLYHVHQLTSEGIKWSIQYYQRLLSENSKNISLDDYSRVYNNLYFNYVLRQYQNYRLLSRAIDKNLAKIPWKIISLVRDPIMREVSDFFFSFFRYPQLQGKEGQALKDETIMVLKNELAKRFRAATSWSLNWFENELKKVFHIDVYDFPFQHQKGYTIIQSKNISILIIQLEKLTQCFSNAFFEYLNIGSLHLISTNIAQEKPYYGIYRYVLDNIAIDPDFCSQIYRSKYCRHFYAQEQIENFLKKWTKNRKA